RFCLCKDILLHLPCNIRESPICRLLTGNCSLDTDRLCFCSQAGKAGQNCHTCYGGIQRHKDPPVFMLFHILLLLTYCNIFTYILIKTYAVVFIFITDITKLLRRLFYYKNLNLSTFLFPFFSFSGFYQKN